MRGQPRIARTWDSVPPVVYDGDEAISTRVLEQQYREAVAALNEIAIMNESNDLTHAKQLAKHTLKSLPLQY